MVEAAILTFSLLLEQDLYLEVRQPLSGQFIDVVFQSDYNDVEI